MARFIQPAELDYTSQYVPLPLEFLNQKIKAEQTGLEGAENALYEYKAGIKGGMLTRDLAGTVNKKIREQAEELAPSLESGDWRGALSKLKAYNREWQKDPVFNFVKNDAEYLKQAESIYKEAISKGELPVNAWYDLKNKIAKQVSEGDINKLGSWSESLYATMADPGIKTMIDNTYARIKGEIKSTTNEDITGLTTDAAGNLMYKTSKEDWRIIDDRVDPRGAIRGAKKELVTTLDSYDSPYGMFYQEQKKQGLIPEQTTEQFVERFWPKFETGDISTSTTYTAVPTPTGGPGIGNINAILGGLDYDISPYGADVTKINLGDVSTDISNSEQAIRQFYNNADQEMYKGLQAAFNGEAPGFLNLISKNEQTVDNILTEAIRQTPAKDVNRIKNLQTIINDPNTLRNMLTDPLTAFSKGGKLNLMLGEANTQKLKKEFYKGMLDLSQNPTNQNDATVSSNFLTNYNQAKELERLNEEKSKVLESALKQSLGDKKEDRELYKLASLVDKYRKIVTIHLDPKDPANRTQSYSIEEINKNPDLIKLKDSGLLSKISGTEEYSFDFSPKYDAAKRIKAKVDNDIKEGKIVIASGKRVINEVTAGEKKGQMGNYQKSTIDLWNADNSKLLTLIQAGSSGLDPEHKNTLKDAFESSPIRDEGFSFGEGSKITGFSFDVSPSGLPMMYVTAKDKAEKISRLEVKFDKNDRFQLGNMIAEMASDDNPDVQDVAANWFAALQLKESDLGLINLFFDSGVNDKAKPIPTSIYFSDDKGTKYGLSVDKFGKTTLGTTTDKTGADGKPIIQPFTVRKTIGGQDIDPNNVTSFEEALRIIGTYNINKIKIGGAQGGGPVGKSQGSPIPVGTTWSTQ